MSFVASSFTGVSCDASLAELSFVASSFTGVSCDASLAELSFVASSFTGVSCDTSLAELSFVASSFTGASFCSAACASLLIPNNKVAPTKIEAVPTENLLIEYLFNLFGKKSNLFFDFFKKITPPILI